MSVKFDPRTAPSSLFARLVGQEFGPTESASQRQIVRPQQHVVARRNLTSEPAKRLVANLYAEWTAIGGVDDIEAFVEAVRTAAHRLEASGALYEGTAAANQPPPPPRKAVDESRFLDAAGNEIHEILGVNVDDLIGISDAPRSRR